jgi:luciferase family oxidoreductase group 1
MKLSIIDQSPVSSGSTPADALRNTIELAKLAEQLGYQRYWIAEHHAMESLASPAPEILIARLGAETSHIRLGSGGVMLPHYSPLKVAETFSMLSGLFPGRIDLGLGRAWGTDSTTALALQRDRRQRAPDDFPEQLAELLAYLGDRMPPEHPFARLAALPGRPERPEAWLLGSSEQSGIWAAELGLPYAFADFINPTGAEIAAHYRATFTPTETLAAPRVIVAAWVMCAETDAEAWRLAASHRMLLTLMHRGRLIRVPPVETALRFLSDEGLPPEAAPPGRRAIVGAPHTVRRGIEAVAREYGADEVMIVNIVHDHVARRRSYELVADVFGLPHAAG